MNDMEIDNSEVVELGALTECVSAFYEPKRDITVYELAILVPYLIRGGLTEKAWTDIGVARRHLRRTD